MSDLISRESVIKELNKLWRYVQFDCDQDVFDIIMKAPAIEQGEAVKPQFPTMLRKMWSGGEVQEWIDENWTFSYTTPQQPQSVADALEEALGICAKIKTPENFTDAEKHIFEQATTEYWRAIRALIKRNAKEGE